MANANNANTEAQTEKPFRVQVNMRLAELEMTVTELATQLDLARNTVSLAINQDRMMPAVKQRIREALEL